MTEGECHCALFYCHCERSVAISGKQKSKIKMQNDRAKIKKQSAVSGQRLAND
jgi:hypothetical protein